MRGSLGMRVSSWFLCNNMLIQDLCFYMCMFHYACLLMKEIRKHWHEKQQHFPLIVMQMMTRERRSMTLFFIQGCLFEDVVSCFHSPRIGSAYLFALCVFMFLSSTWRCLLYFVDLKSDTLCMTISFTVSEAKGIWKRIFLFFYDDNASMTWPDRQFLCRRWHTFLCRFVSHVKTVSTDDSFVEESRVSMTK